MQMHSVVKDHHNAFSFKNAAFFSTQRNATTAVSTMMVDLVLRGKLHTVLSSRRPCRCKREETPLRKRRTSERCPFCHHDAHNTIDGDETSVTDSLTSDTEKIFKKTLCENMYFTTDICNAITTYIIR